MQAIPKIPAPSAPLLELLQKLKTEVARYDEIKTRRDQAMAAQQAAQAQMAELHGERARTSQPALINPRAVARLEEKTAIVRERSLEAVATVRETQRDIVAAAKRVEHQRCIVATALRQELEPFIKIAVSTIERLAGELIMNLHMLAELAVVTGAGRTVVEAQISHPTKREDLAMRPLQIDISPNITPWREFRRPLREAEWSWEYLEQSEAAE